MRNLPRLMRVAVVVAVVGVLGALTGSSGSSATAATPKDSNTPTAFIYTLRDATTGNAVWSSGPTTAKRFSSPRTVTAAAQARPYSVGGQACYRAEITALSGIFRTPLFTMYMLKCWTWYLGTVINPGQSQWIQVRAGNWCCERISYDIRYFYTYFGGIPNSGHASQAGGEVACVFIGIPGGCGYGHPWIHFYAHGEGSLYWSAGWN